MKIYLTKQDHTYYNDNGRILNTLYQSAMQNQAESATATRPRQTGRMLRRSLLQSPFADIIQFLALLSLSAWFLTGAVRDSGYHWQWYQIPKYILLLDEQGFHAGPLLLGLLVTLQISAASLVLASVIGLATALMQLSSSLVARATAKVYIESIRNTPLLIQLFFIYFVLGPVLGIGRFPSAILALSLFEGAYAAEIIRAGIISIQRGQWEACYSLGMTAFDSYLTVILPQALRRILPPLTGQAISLIKDSALVSTIAIYDLTMQAQAIIAETFLTFEIWFTVALMYLGVTLTLSLMVRQMEHRFRIY
jgi:polar amino acid transport system permease protein